MKKFFREMLNNSDNVSSSRVIMFLVIVPVMILWVAFCIRNDTFLDIPWGWVSVIGALVGGRTIQKFHEPITCPPEGEIDKYR